MPYALCPLIKRAPHVTEKGYKSKYLPSSNPVDASWTPAESIDTLAVASITEERCFELLRL